MHLSLFWMYQSQTQHSKYCAVLLINHNSNKKKSLVVQQIVDVTTPPSCQDVGHKNHLMNHLLPHRIHSTAGYYVPSRLIFPPSLFWAYASPKTQK